MKIKMKIKGIISSVQSLSCVQLFATPWTAARQASLSITNSQSLLKLMSTESVTPSSHLILLSRPLLLLPSIFPSIRVRVNPNQGIWTIRLGIPLSLSSRVNRLTSLKHKY